MHDSIDQQVLIHGSDGRDLGGLVVDDDERAVLRREQMVCERVADVTVHPAFKDMVNALARVYDLQNGDQYRDEMTYLDPDSGVRTSLSWLMPRSAEDWQRKRRHSGRPQDEAEPRSARG